MEKEIMSMTIAELLDTENLYNYSSEPSEVQEQIKSLYIARLGELNASKLLIKQVLKIFEALDIENKKRKNAEKLSEYGVQLETDEKGNIVSTIENFLLILQSDEYFDNLCFNKATREPGYMRKGKFIPFDSASLPLIKLHIEKHYGIRNRNNLNLALQIFYSENEVII